MKLKNIEVPVDRIAALCQNWHIQKLSLFGSVIRNDFTPESDIDVLVEFERVLAPGFLKLYKIEEKLSDLFGQRRIDMVTSKFLNHHQVDRILEEAEVCYVAKR